MSDLVLAVVVRLQMLHVEAIVGRTHSTEVEGVTDLETDPVIESSQAIGNECIINVGRRFTLKKLLRVLLTIILTPSI